MTETQMKLVKKCYPFYILAAGERIHSTFQNDKFEFTANQMQRILDHFAKIEKIINE